MAFKWQRDVAYTNSLLLLCVHFSDMSAVWWKCALAISFVFLMLLIFYTASVEKRSATSSNTNIQLSIISDDDGGAMAVKRRHKQHVPKFMLDLFHNNNKNYNNGPDVVRSVVPKTTDFIPGNSREPFTNKHMLTFELPRSSKDEIFLDAELKILSICNENYHNLEKYVKISIFDDTNGELLFFDKLRFYSKNNTWLSFNLTSPLHVLLANDDNKHINVVISINSQVLDNIKLSLLPDVENAEHDYPILLLSYNTTRGSRKKINTYNLSDGQREKRSTFEEDYEEDTNNVWDDNNQRKGLGRRWKRIRNTCRRKPLYVDFSEIDFDSWIVQPSGYEAFQCHGKCFYPVAEHLSPTKHAIVQALVHNMSPSRASRSCCVPTKLDSISVLYIDSKGVLTYRYAYEDMVVSECGCR